MNDIMVPQFIAIHTAAYSGRNCDAQVIDRWHRERGFDRIGYHFVIINNRHDHYPDGKVQIGRPLGQEGAHIRGLNDRSIGICLVGDGDREPPTPAQYAALDGLLSWLTIGYGLPAENVIGHREINRLRDEGRTDAPYTTKSCPGEMIDMDTIRQRLRATLAHAAGLTDIDLLAMASKKQEGGKQP